MIVNPVKKLKGASELRHSRHGCEYTCLQACSSWPGCSSSATRLPTTLRSSGSSSPAGVVEVWTALWVSDGEARDGRSRRAFGKVVHWASVVPLVAVAGIGGYTVLVNMFD
ncbi:hypothetical protein E2562_023389 [Oryza meyeriana var. granulata]|uniref:Uncharacterized protein n=1 Tax=Oryza meyeriana var. granulata TaxID=110450 RepID=A0A6G1E0K1_9ORYZ|nr:hypothetical protein E2562_023389 [Oryza meyeriana var. granulata]